MNTPQPVHRSDRGLVGERQLLAVQTFDIARLTTHVVPIVPGTFIAVSGVGPDGDSNGSGKTSFLSAVSVLLADPQWCLEANGSRSVSGLLFKPDAAGISKAHRIPAAQYGYVVGVFGHPDDPVGTALTVWVRIEVVPPYVQARWTTGLHVADSDSEAERMSQADSLWSALGSTNSISARRMAEELYGLAPRCLSYLDTPLRRAVPSLLSQQMTKMKPHEIGDSLIALSGLKTQLDDEERLRDVYLDHRRDLENAEQADADARIDEDADLAGIFARQQAREALAAGGQSWNLYLGQRCREVSQQAQLLHQEIADQEEILRGSELASSAARTYLQELLKGPDLTIEEASAKDRWRQAQSQTKSVEHQVNQCNTRQVLLARERMSLAHKLEGWTGATLEEAAEELDRARQDYAAACANCNAARDYVGQAGERLARAEKGRGGAAGSAIELLAQQTPSITASALFDVLEIDDNSRVMWEPRLWSWRNAVVVLPADAGRAREALAVVPGTQVVTADDPSAMSGMPDGIESRVALGTFLAALAVRFAHQQEPPLAEDQDLRLSVTGGFEQPVTGRDALIRDAAEELRAAHAALALAKTRVTTTEAKFKLAELDHQAAEAAARLNAIAEEEESLAKEVKSADTQLAEANRLSSDLEGRWKEAFRRVTSQAQEREIANFRFQDAERIEKDQQSTLNGKRRELEKLRVPDWHTMLLRRAEDRGTVTLADTAAMHRSALSLFRSASDKLKEALRFCGADSNAGSPMLSDLARLRDEFADQDPKTLPETLFEHVAGPILAMLDSQADSDQITATRITAQRDARSQSLEALGGEVTKAADRLEVLQDMIQSHIEAILRRISNEFDNLDRQRGGFGAAVRHDSRRPNGAGQWEWEVVPCWRRSPSGDLVPYHEIANSAQVKVIAVQLVLAALLADQDTNGRILVLDELGNSLGDVNRKDVLRALQSVAERQQVTILGTCQDSVLADAGETCGELLWFTHASASDAYNRQTHVWGYDALSQRVVLTADWVRAGRGLV